MATTRRYRAPAVTIFLLIGLFTWSGCSKPILASNVVTAMDSATPPSLQSTFERLNPLRVDKKQADAIKTVLLAPSFDKSVAENGAIYLAEGLSKNGRFKVLPRAAVAQEVAKTGVNPGVMTVVEKIALTRRIGRTLGADAIVVLLIDEIAVKIGGQILPGRMSIEGKNRLQLYLVASGDLLWEQVQQVKLTLTVEIFKTPESRNKLLQAGLQAELDPLIANFLSSFLPPESAAK